MNQSAFIRYLTIPAVLLLNALTVGFAIYLFTISNNIYTVSIAVVFAFLSGISTIFNLQAAIAYYDSYSYEQKFKKMRLKFGKLSRYPTVAVVVPSYNEDLRVVKTAMLKLKQAEYDRKKVNFYLLDDSTNSEISADLSAFAKKNGVTYVHREQRHAFKAGAMNNFLAMKTGEEFIAVFDADEYLIKKRFLVDLLPFFDDRKVAYVQTEKTYQRGSFFSDSVTLFNGFFFNFIQPSRASRNTQTFAGSCGILRRSAVEEIGGFPEYIVEDTFLSFDTRMKDYKGIYIPRTYALGRPINKFTAFARQQWRYNYGSTQFLRHYLKESKKSKMKPMEKLDYFSLGFGLNYLSVILILFSVLSILVVLMNAPWTSSSLSHLLYPSYIEADIEYFSILALVVSFVAPLLVSRIYFGSFKYGIMIFFLNFGLAFIRARAGVAAVLGMDPKFGWVKGDTKGKGMRFIAALRNSLAEMVFSVGMLGLGVLSLAANNFSGGIWLLWYCMLYGSTFFFFYRYG